MLLIFLEKMYASLHSLRQSKLNSHRLSKKILKIVSSVFLPFTVFYSTFFGNSALLSATDGPARIFSNHLMPRHDQKDDMS